jgi:hypothetical protein
MLMYWISSWAPEIAGRWRGKQPRPVHYPIYPIDCFVKIIPKTLHHRPKKHQLLLPSCINLGCGPDCVELGDHLEEVVVEDFSDPGLDLADIGGDLLDVRVYL